MVMCILNNRRPGKYLDVLRRWMMVYFKRTGYGTHVLRFSLTNTRINAGFTGCELKRRS